jgi:5'-phosphate synthase pdxT subunit
MRIGVLAVQGAFIEHETMLRKLGIDCFEIRQKKDALRDYDGLILPGGESTVMGKLLRELDMLDVLQNKIRAGLPVFGTCAGLILLAKKIDGEEQSHIASMDVEVVRNAYGRQLGSFDTQVDFSDNGKVSMVFIRAPYIKKYGNSVDVLSTVDDRIVAARQGNQLACAFHPELTEDTTVHEYFINMVKQSFVCCE